MARPTRRSAHRPTGTAPPPAAETPRREPSPRATLKNPGRPGDRRALNEYSASFKRALLESDVLDRHTSVNPAEPPGAERRLDARRDRVMAHPLLSCLSCTVTRCTGSGAAARTRWINELRGPGNRLRRTAAVNPGAGVARPDSVPRPTPPNHRPPPWTADRRAEPPRRGATGSGAAPRSVRPSPAHLWGIGAGRRSDRMWPNHSAWSSLAADGTYGGRNRPLRFGHGSFRIKRDRR